jgi:hypothetical protein
MGAKASSNQPLTLACRWSRDPRTGRLEAHWQCDPVKREDVMRHFTQVK